MHIDKKMGNHTEKPNYQKKLPARQLSTEGPRLTRILGLPLQLQHFGNYTQAYRSWVQKLGTEAGYRNCVQELCRGVVYGNWVLKLLRSNFHCSDTILEIIPKHTEVGCRSQGQKLGTKIAPKIIPDINPEITPDVAPKNHPRNCLGNCPKSTGPKISKKNNKQFINKK